MRTKCLTKSALACLLTLSPLVAEAASPSLYGLSKRAGGSDELFTYDLTQDVSSSFEYRANTLLPLNEDPLGGTVTAIAVSGSNLYALSKRAGGSDELITYDLAQDISSSLEYRANTLLPLNEDPLGGTVTAIAVSGNNLYALSKRDGGSDELFTYDLTQDISSSLEYRANTLLPLNEDPLGGTVTAIAVSGSNLYALSKRTGGSDELFTYDLTQDISSSLEYGANTLLPLNEDPLGGTVTAIAVSGSNLYALSKRDGGSDELFTYDLMQDISSSFEYRANTLLPLNEDPLGGTVIAIATDGTPSGDGSGGGGSTPVPEPSTYALMMIGMLALATLKGRRFRPMWSRA
jgi:PEP-CTERM motif